MCELNFEAVGSTTNYLAEVQAIVDRVERAIHRGWTTLWIVSDSSATIKAFISSKIPWKFQSRWRNLLTSIQAICFNSIWREANFLANTTTKRGSRADQPFEKWVEGRPDTFLTDSFYSNRILFCSNTFLTVNFYSNRLIIYSNTILFE
ncbi:hypothetical protein GIB67_029725 [Kingdonia uniflora]|uniref:RNase H type-1 domain-containing protein n=1 Tax=Kingdonia uniflora TaxID=39325 RepID=A0A7J7LLM8_9MAGN|nr:hypothetical protein GIB67_029725 [Kingdonia uniflora]